MSTMRMVSGITGPSRRATFEQGFTEEFGSGIGASSVVEQLNNDLVDIVVVDAGPRRIGVFSIIPRLTKLNIKQARKLVDEAPQAVITRVPRVQAEALKIEMEASRRQRRAP